MRSLVYATRRSALALAQCRAFVARLRALSGAPALSELQVVTTGDKIQDRPLAEIGGKGLFVKEIEEALLDGRADLAVHSIKDVPGALPGGLGIACIPAREDPRDVLVAPRHGALAALPEGATVGTSSLRRAISLRLARPDLRIVPMRGNVDTRLRKVDGGECEAIVLARAGLVRLGLEARATEVLEPEVSLPAVGQGALGIECRDADDEVRALLARVHDVDTATCVEAERGVLIALGADCKTPLAAHARRDGEELHLRAFVADEGGGGLRRAERRVAWPDQAAARDLGMALGRHLVALGALLLVLFGVVGRAEAKPVHGGPDPLRLDVPGVAPAYYLKPTTHAQRPVLMFLHGRGGDPLEDCRKWAKVAKEFGWVVCPSGPHGGAHHRTWSNDPETARKTIDATMAALRAKFGARVRPRANVLIGFSEGAFIAQHVGLRDPEHWNRWLILAANDKYWFGDGPQLLEVNHRKIRRVFLFTGEHDEVAGNTRRAGEMLKTARIPVRVQIQPGMGHEIPADRMVLNYRRPLRWLISAK